MNPQAKVTLSADDSPLRQSLREMVGKFREFGDSAGKEVDKSSAPLLALRDKFVAISALLAGGALFGKAVQQASEFTEQSIQLGKALGQSASGASVWIESLKDVGAGTDEFATAAKGLLKNVRENEDELNKMGLATRDASGNLRPMNALMLDAIKLTNEYAAGTDRGVAAQKIWGKGVDASSNILKVNTETVRENEAAMRDLGLVVGQDDVESYERYDSAMDRAHMTMRALMNAIGQALMPVLTKLGEWFNTSGPAAVLVVRGSIGGLVAVFWGLKNAITIVWETLNAMVVTVAEPIRALAAGFYKVVTGDFRGAAEEFQGMPARIAAAWSQGFDEIIKSSEEVQARLAELFLDGPDAAVKPGGDKRAPVKDDKKAKALPDGPSSYMQYYDGLLAEERRAFSILNAGREYTKEQELAYWRWLSDNLQFTSADKLAVLRKTAGLELEISRRTAQERAQIDADATATAEKFALGRVDAEAAAARTAQDLGAISKAQLAGLEVQFEQQRYAIQASALQQRLALLEKDPTTNPVEMARIKNELLLLEQQHQTQRLQLLGQQQKEEGSFGNLLTEMVGSEAGWNNLFNGLIARTLTWQQAMSNIFSSVVQAFLNEFVTKAVAGQAKALATMLAQKLGFLQAEQAAQAVSSGVIVGEKEIEALGVVSANAAEAGSGAAASQASIPYVGPYLALAAMAAVFGAVMALGSTKSARGGYNIPAGANPMTQLHEEEMVLPADIANPLRRMVAEYGAGAGQASGAAAGAVNIHTAGGDFIHKRDLAKLLKQMKRDFAFV